MVERAGSWRVATVALIFAALAAVAIWQAGQLRTRAYVSGSEDSGLGVTLYPGDRGIPLPQIEGRTVAGDMFALSDLREHVVVVNVWGSWCGPCRAEAPTLAMISKEARPSGVRFVGIDLRDNSDAALAFERKYDIGYPSFDDAEGLVLAQFTGIIPVSAVPSTLVADRFGVIRARVVGQVDDATLRELISDAGQIT